MIPYLGCDAAREMLQGFVDGELPMTDQVAVESHLRWCATCSARVEDTRLIGAGIRLAAPAQETTSEDLSTLAAIQSEVLTRIRAEHDQSLPVRLGGMFEDMRFLWPAFGATAALVFGLFTALAVHRAASAADPASIANMIQMLARQSAERRPHLQLGPLSSYYPVQLDALMLAPRPLSEGPALDSLPEDEAVFALSAVVTREGRVADYELLQSVRDGVRRRGESAALTDEVDAMLAAVKRSRFEPAQGVGGDAVTVRVVWLLARTTVKAEAGAKPLTDEEPPPAPRLARS
ncbi:MAG: zf-HC2 domain-containing protein [Acidobacteria bacterium]|nr:zf-HC2 domain-containing protein [Acidobacteriota bacterium]